MNKTIKITLRVIGVLALLAVITVLVCYYVVSHDVKGVLYSDVNDIPGRNTGLLLGTTPQTRYGGSNMFFKYRIDAAEKLYKERKIDILIISGDENSLDGVNEPKCMKDSLVARGVPAYVIYLDGKGFSTFDSIVMMCRDAGINSFTVISQEFQNERAIYLAKRIGMDIEYIQAFNAESPNSAWALLTYLREYLARVKMFIDIFTDGKKFDVPAAPIDKSSDMWFKAFLRSYNTISAHSEQDTIVGNFTGEGRDTLYVSSYVEKYEEEDGSYTHYYMESPNPKIPKIEIWGDAEIPPKLVNEGDLDGNGTTDVGYLHTWINSQWRQYRIFTLVNYEWRHLVDGRYLHTPGWFRHSGVEVAEPGPEKGTVLIHHYNEIYGEEPDCIIHEILDTIVRPTFSPIDEDD